MVTLSILSTIYCFVGIALASPVKSSGAFSLGLSRRAGQPLSGPARHVADLRRHGRSIHPDLLAAAQDPSLLVEEYLSQFSSAELDKRAKQTGSAPTTGNVTYGWQVPVTIGKSQLNLYIDTGSSDLWVYSNLLPPNETTGHNLYDTSTGTVLKNYTYKIEYRGNAGSAGLVYQDTVVIGGATATSQAIEAATALAAVNPFGPADGVLGLGPDTLNSIKPKRQQTLWQTLDPSLPEPIFAADFTPTGGSLDFGYINPKYQDSVTYTKIERFSNPLFEYYWINFTNFEVDDSIYTPRPYEGESPMGIIDAGTTGVYVSYRAAKFYYSKVASARYVYKQWVFDCSEELPDFGINIAGKDFSCPGAYLTEPLEGHPGVCYGLLQGAVGPYNTYDAGDLIGTPFFIGTYIVFDKLNNQIGFAAKN